MTKEQREELLGSAALNPTEIDHDRNDPKQDIIQDLSASNESAQNIISNLINQGNVLNNLPIANLQMQSQDGVDRAQNLLDSEKHKFIILWGSIAVIVILFLIVFLYFVFKSY